MPFIPFIEDQKKQANNTDLVSFLQMRGEKPKRAGREYKLIYTDETGQHDSITISGSTWFDHKAQEGGGAVKFMQRFYGMSFSEAVQALLVYSVQPLSHSPPQTPKPEQKKEFRLPEASSNMHRVYAYLIKQRFIAPDDREKRNLYTEEMLQNICLGLHSMCKGAESKYFNGHTNIKDGEFICFGVKGLMDSNKKLKNTMLFNILSFMSNQILGKGNTVAVVDKLYLLLTNMTAIEYIRNGMKRVWKKKSSFVLASQNIEDFLLPEIKEFTKPLFSIPSHQFLFFPGNILPVDFIDTLQLEESECCLIRYPERGTCLYRCGNERYLLQIMAPDYKAALFGNAGGR